jgi:hypothetical protein
MTSFIQITNLYGPSHEDWSLGDFLSVRFGRLDIFAFLVARRVGQVVVQIFHSVTNLLQVLVGIIVDILQVAH